MYPKLSHKQNKLDENDCDIHLRVDAFGRTLNANLVVNHNLVTPDVTMDVIGSNGGVLNQKNMAGTYYYGRVNEDATSHVSLLHNEGLVRVFKVD